MQQQSIPYRAIFASNAADARPEQPYADNLAHLTDLELEAQLHLMLARQLAVERPPGLLERANDPANDPADDRADDREAAAAPHSPMPRPCAAGCPTCSRPRRAI